MKRSLHCVFVCLLGLSLAALVPVAASAQAVYGSIHGSVTDPSGAAIAGAQITITSLGQGTTQDFTSNAAGNYVVTHLIPGRYSVRVESSGFKIYLVEEVEVFADVGSRIDAVMEVGGIAETVTVTLQDTPLLKTDRADVAIVFDSDAIAELPILDRNFTRFTLLSPGASTLGWQHASSENPQASLQTMVNGQHFSGTSFQLDGTDNRDPILGIIVINPTLESITHSKITSQNYDAEFGMASAGVITAQTKSGTNDFHGSLFWYRRDEETQARNPFSQSSRDPLNFPNSMWNQFGGSIGGPAIENKLFFFADYQGTRRRLGGSFLTQVPTDLVRSTCLAGLDCDLSEYLRQIFDPATGNPDGTGRTEFAGGIIPAGQISPQAITILSLLPAPNVSGAGISNNFAAGGSEKFDDDILNVRSDFKASDNLNIFGRYTYADFEKSAPAIFGIAGGPGLGDSGGGGQGVDGGFAGSSLVTNQSVAAGFDYVVTPSIITDFRIGWFSYEVDVLPFDVGSRPAADAGIPGLNLDDFFTSGMPFMDIQGNGGFRLGSGLGTNRCNCPLKQDEWQVQFVNNWTFLQGDHTFKFGADIRHARNLRVPSDRHRAGELSFNNSRTEDVAGAGGGLGLATFLLGDVTFMSRYVSNTLDAAERQNRMFFYGQDTWRVNSKFTLNYGVRWEIYNPEYVNRAGAGGWLDIQTGLLRVGGVGSIGNDGNVKNDYGNIAPRIGIAYELNEKTIIRLGYGKSFDVGTFGSHFGHAVTQNLPVLATQEVRGPTGSSFETAFTFDSGPPALDIATVCDFQATGTCPLPNGIFSRVRPEKQKMLEVDSWNLTIQRQITPTMTLDVAYVGNKGTHVFTGDGPDYNGNQPTLVGFGTLSGDERKPFFNGPIGSLGGAFGWGQGIAFLLNNGDNHYNSLQVKLNKRFSNGLQFLSHYTWQKTLGENGDYFIWDPKLNYGPREWERQHAFIFTGLYELPYGRGKQYGSDISSALDHVLGGWQLNTAINWSSGLPFSPGYSNCGTDRDTGPCRPNRVGNVGKGSAGQFFQTSGVVGLANGETGGPWQRPQVGTFGTATLNSLRGPKFFNTDLTIMKTFQLSEQMKLDFQAQAFNIFNHINLANPNSCVDCDPATDGRIFGMAPGALARRWQFGLRLSF